MRRFMTIVFFLTSSAIVSFAQSQKYSPANLHSHNDYDRPDPFYNAFKNGIGSIEADIFLHDGKLLVAHELNELRASRTLERLYLRPLQKMIRKNGKYLFAGNTHNLILLIDVKSAARPAIDSLVQLLKNFPELITSPVLKIAISGNRPALNEWKLFPDFIYFDGVAGKNYPDSALGRIALMSENFHNFSDWIGSGPVDKEQMAALQKLVENEHARNKLVRLWYTPDNKATWDLFMKLGVDLINTDKVDEAAEYILGIP
ncbi:alkaline phosphatase [Pollutibacter soli]|uniref:alkaline phosphatase n=1 Tax=Pollutibacter soli TaxID=3034157 RepID=UPI003013D70F